MFILCCFYTFLILLYDFHKRNRRPWDRNSILTFVQPQLDAESTSRRATGADPNEILRRLRIWTQNTMLKARDFLLKNALLQLNQILSIITLATFLKDL